MNDIFDCILNLVNLAKQNDMKLSVKEVEVNILFDSLAEALTTNITDSEYEKAVKLNTFKYNIKNLLDL